MGDASDDGRVIFSSSRACGPSSPGHPEATLYVSRLEAVSPKNDFVPNRIFKIKLLAASSSSTKEPSGRAGHPAITLTLRRSSPMEALLTIAGSIRQGDKACERFLVDQIAQTILLGDAFLHSSIEL